MVHHRETIFEPMYLRWDSLMASKSKNRDFQGNETWEIVAASVLLTALAVM